MKKPGAKEPSAAELRRLAERRLRSKQATAPRHEAPRDQERLNHELQVHQIELEMQNEELRRVRDELEVSLARYTELYDFAPVGYVTLDERSTILEINLAGAAMLGKERARMIGQGFAPCVAAATRPAFDAFVGKLREGADKASCDVALATHGDRNLHVHIDGMREPTGRDWRCRAAMTDITQRDEAEEALEQQRARLLEAERRARLEAERVGELQRLTLGVVGHDLRSPIQAIQMNSDLLVRRGDLDQDQAECVLRIGRSARRVAGIIRDLLDYTRARQGETLQIERRDVDLSDLCRTIVLETRSIHPERDIAFESSGECVGSWDPERVGQVISNLLSNALQHGGPPSQVRVSLAADESAATITVFNDGQPIPREARAIIFEPYRRADTGERKAGAGLGLGLFIVREIARAHGGQVTLESDAGGTSFVVRLPRRAGDVTAPAGERPDPASV